jgi:hypothetical protein
MVRGYRGAVAELPSEGVSADRAMRIPIGLLMGSWTSSKEPEQALKHEI